MTRANAQLFEKIGAVKLRAVIEDFYARVFADVMIGFMFQGKDRTRLVDKEYEFTAQLLGADVKYTGRPMRVAHAQATIFGGQFERRLQILRETLRDHAVDADVVATWIDHSLALREQITKDRGSECDTVATTPKLAVAVPSPDPESRVKLGRRK